MERHLSRLVSLGRKAPVVKQSRSLIVGASFQEYSKALSYVRAFLQIEPANVQVQNLESLIRKKMEKGFPFIYYRLKRIKLVIYLGAISLRDFCDFLTHSYYFWLLLLILLFSCIAKFYIDST